jgi:RsiW-degrading membrane proteinase PrsW (M82 family)
MDILSSIYSAGLLGSKIVSPIFISFIFGVFPALLWLWFWLREDKEHPEPPKYILLTFLFGALAVPCALILQLNFNNIFLISNTSSLIESPFLYVFIIVLFWATIEESVKYIAAWFGGLRHSITDEAVDVPIYMISAALGFAALENTLFLITPMLDGNLAQVIATTKLRFIGATLVHIASSALIGMFAGYSLFFSKSIQRRYVYTGFVLAIVLHALFNLFIIKGSQNSFVGFLLIWLFIVVIVVLFERIKKIKVTRIQNVRQKEKENIN